MSRAVQPRFGQFAFGKCTLDILHQRGAFFTVIACGYRVLTWDLFPNQSAYKKPSSKQHARNSIWVLIWLLFQFQPASILVFECGLGQTISKAGRKQFTGTKELKLTQSHPQLWYSWIPPVTVSPTPSLMARCYTKGFCEKLLELYEGRSGFQPPLRQKLKINPRKSDREIFHEMELGDIWLDAGLHMVWKYVFNNKHIRIPDSWADTMAQFDKELTARVL